MEDTPRKPIIEDQARYDFEMDITELMSPGKWELKVIKLGRKDPEPVPFVQQVSFEIPSLRPIVVHLQGAPTAEAGNVYVITATLAEFPTDHYADGCERSLYVYADHVPPAADQVQFGSLILIRGQLSYKFLHKFEPDFPSGPLLAGVRAEAHWMQDEHDMGCRYPPLQGDLQHRFEIVPSKSLVRPTSVVVTVNSKQADLLIQKIDRLNQLKKQINSKGATATQAVLQSSVEEAKKDLDQTEELYKEKGNEPSFTPAIEVFFGDIRLHYNKTLKALAKNSAQAPQTEPRLKNVNTALENRFPQPNSASDLALGIIEWNIAAYGLAVSTKELSFNLDVNSSPMGAQIFYKRDDEDDFHRWDRDTNSTVFNLVRAWYTIRITLDGYISEDRPLDANKDPNPSINISLKPKPGVR